LLPGSHLFQDSAFTSFIHVLAISFVILAFAVLAKIFKKAKSLKQKSLLYLWLTVSLLYLIALGLSFPGWIGYDDCVMAYEVFKGQAWGWQSMTYSFVTASGYLLFGTAGFTSVLFVFYFLYLVLIVIQIIDHTEVAARLKFFAALLLFVFSLWPTKRLFYFIIEILYLLLFRVIWVCFWSCTKLGANTMLLSLL
jgi:hypothetical protein